MLATAFDARYRPFNAKDGSPLQNRRARVSCLHCVSNFDDAAIIVQGHDLRFADSLLIFRMITFVQTCPSSSRITVCRFTAFIQDDLIREDVIIAVQNHDVKTVDATSFLSVRAVSSR